MSRFRGELGIGDGHTFSLSSILIRRFLDSGELEVVVVERGVGDSGYLSVKSENGETSGRVGVVVGEEGGVKRFGVDSADCPAGEGISMQVDDTMASRDGSATARPKLTRTASGHSSSGMLFANELCQTRLKASVIPWGLSSRPENTDSTKFWKASKVYESLGRLLRHANAVS